MEAEKQDNPTPLSKLNAGPKGFGDPADRTLRKVELEVLIPKMARERLKVEHCREQKAAFDRCCLANGLLMVAKCREENRCFQDCMARWFFDRSFMAECTEAYLEKRAQFRRTGHKEKTKRMM